MREAKSLSAEPTNPSEDVVGGEVVGGAVVGGAVVGGAVVGGAVVDERDSVLVVVGVVVVVEGRVVVVDVLRASASSVSSSSSGGSVEMTPERTRAAKSGSEVVVVRGWAMGVALVRAGST